MIHKRSPRPSITAVHDSPPPTLDGLTLGVVFSECLGDQPDPLATAMTVTQYLGEAFLRWCNNQLLWLSWAIKQASISFMYRYIIAW